MKLEEPDDQDLEVSDSGDEETENNQQDFSPQIDPTEDNEPALSPFSPFGP